VGAYRALTEGWTVSGGGMREVPATVPGCVHTDLLAAGLIPDPYRDDNERELAWIGRTTWEYRTSFDWEPGAEHAELVCEGLDTVATVVLNGVELGRTENMHRSYAFDVRAVLRGHNDLLIRFDSAYDYAQAHRERLGELPNAYDEPFNFIRKQACNFGWDWGPTLVTAGAWRPVGLREWSGSRVEEVRPHVTVVEGRGRVDLRVRVKGEIGTPVTASLAGAEPVAAVWEGDDLTLSLTVDDPELWWPVGYGDQPLYALEVRASDDVWRGRVGFRTVHLDTSSGGYTLVVNGQPVFVRGVNWIPDDVFAHRSDPGPLLRRAREANVNFVRVWGGGRYESDDFYDLADELGLMVGQDFLFACAAYPEEEPFASEVEAEARENVVRLSPHPSLMVWTGNNENLWGHRDWGWAERVAGRTWGSGFYLDLLPRVVAEEDPGRPYWPGSPWSGREDLHPNDPAYGTTHIWDVWNSDDYTKYREYRPRFVAEFGYQAPPAYATLRAALSDEPLAPDSPGMRAHQKAADGDAKLRRGLEAHLPEPRDFDDWHFLTQVNQARALSLGIEHFRALWPYCAGAIMWQLNDCWPVTSWAAIDGDGRRKPLWYALRRSFAPRLLTFQPREGLPTLIAVNDTGEEWALSVTISRRTVAGVVEAEEAIGVTVAPRTTTTLPVRAQVGAAGDASREFLLAEADGDRAWWFFAEDRDIRWPEPRYETELSGTHLVVRAATMLRDLTVYADRADPAAEADDAGVTLLPGESATFDLGRAVDPVLRCVNDVIVRNRS
jgi:beta-mannosidase